MPPILEEVKKHMDKDYHCGSYGRKEKRVCAYARFSTDSKRQEESWKTRQKHMKD